METRKCFFCNKITKNKKFCSKSCSAKVSNKKPKRKKVKKLCSKCDNFVRNNRSLLCEHHHQERMKYGKDYLMNLTLADYTERDSIKKLHQSSKFAHIRGLNRSWNKDLVLMPCKICGYTKHVELAHIIPISKFPGTAKLKDINSKSNVVPLCPNCHWEFDNGLVSLVFPEQL